MTNGVYIALSAFGPDRVRTLGQPAFFAIAAAAGAEGVEVRRELFADAVPPLSAMAAFGRDLGLRRRYSVPFELHGADGALQADELARYAAEAEALGADVLKVSLGHAPEVPDRAALASLVAGLPCRLLIENDQTPQGGRLAPLAAFLEATADLAIGLTFDVGNWSWTGEDAVDAIARLAPSVAYVHCKSAATEAGKLVARPLAPASALAAAVFSALPPGLPRAIEFPIEHPPIMLKQHDRQVAAQLIESGAFSHRSDASIRSENALVGDDLIAATRHHVNQLAGL
jgi:2-dehydro-3-deoxygluconokinase